MSHTRLLVSVLIVAVAVVAYAPTVDNYFVQDDFGVVWLLSQKPAAYFPRWFVTSWMDTIWGDTPDEVRPFVAVTYQLAAVPGAGLAVANHLINVAFHAATGLLVFGVARHAARLTLTASMLAAVVFVLLPNQAETAAWITGRVDSMPAFFYLASFLTWARWRREGRRSLYVWSVVWCFVALFSKQNAITLVPAFLLYDVIVERMTPAASWTWVRSYVPHAALTAGYLALRYVLFGEVAREDLLTTTQMGQFADWFVRHVIRIVSGTEMWDGGAEWMAVVVVAVFAVAWWRSRRSALYFGIIWLVLGLMPTLVSTYISSRHAYLASAGWALIIGVAFDALWHPMKRSRQAIAVAAVAMLIVVYAVQLPALVRDWEARADLAEKAVRDLEREASAAPDGTLIIAGVPQRSWGFALPFAAKPPFTRTDLISRVLIVSRASLDCCQPDQWEASTRQRLQQWLQRSDRPPAIAMYWDPASANLLRLSDRDDPTLRDVIELLADTGDRAALDANISRLLTDFVALNSRTKR